MNRITQVIVGIAVTAVYFIGAYFLELMELAALVYIILGALGAYLVGVLRLAKYGFRLGTGIGLALIFFPPYMFYFAFKKLEVDGKAFPTALSAFGVLLTALLIAAFFQPLSTMATGDIAKAQDMLSEDIVQERDDDDEDDEEDEIEELREEADEDDEDDAEEEDEEEDDEDDAGEDDEDDEDDE